MSEKDRNDEILQFANDVYDLDVRVYKAVGSKLGRVFTEDRSMNVQSVVDALNEGREHIVRSEVALIGNMARTLPDEELRSEIMTSYGQLVERMESLIQGSRDRGVCNVHKAELNELNLRERFGKKDHLVICISRSYGCGGGYIGFKLADAFHGDYYDAEILSAMLKRWEKSENAEESESGEESENETRLRRKELAYRWQDSSLKTNPGLAYVEKHPSLKERIHRINKYHGLPTRDALFFYQTDLILDLAKRKNFVIMGRCADQILTNHNVPHVSIYLTAPEEQRIQRVMNINHVDHRTAKKQLREVDHAHASYYKYFTGKEWGDAKNYDLCINTSIFGVQGTIDFVLRAMGKDVDGDFMRATPYGTVKTPAVAHWKSPINPELGDVTMIEGDSFKKKGAARHGLMVHAKDEK